MSKERQPKPDRLRPNLAEQAETLRKRLGRGRFDGCCPHCHRPIVALHDMWADRDYELDFESECPHCEKTIRIVVHLVQEFELIEKTS